MIDNYIQQYGKRLYGLCLSLCGNPFDANDLYQETWLRAFQNISKYDPALDFEPWLTKICVNIYKNQLRRLARSPLIEFSTNEEKDRVMDSLAEPQEKDYTPLYEAIDNLPEKFRIVIILFYFRDMDIISTSYILKIPIGTVKSRLNKARKLLKEALKDEADLQF